MDIPQFAYYLPIGAHLGFCQNLVITNKPSGNTHVEVFSGYKFSNQVSKYLAIRLLNQMVSLCLVL